MNLEIKELLCEWRDARKVILEHSIHNIKDDPEYRWRLERLAKAEKVLYDYTNEL